MNPLVEALSKNKTSSAGEDYGGDLHTRKSSHISVPMEAAEFHFSAGDINIQAEPDQTYLLCVGVVCSSSDGHDVRFKQLTKPYLEDERVYSGKTNDEAPLDRKVPLVRTVTEHEPS